MTDVQYTKLGLTGGNPFWKKRALFVAVALVLFTLFTFLFLNTYQPQIGQADEQVIAPEQAGILPKLKPSEIALVMAYDSKESYYLPRSRDNKEEYAKYHGYRFLQDGVYDKSRGAAWGKILSLRKFMKMYPSIKWFWWIDVDTVLMDYSVPLEDRVLANLTKPENANKDLIIAYDINGFNAGSFFIRNTEWSLEFLRLIYEPKYKTRFGYAEQGTMQHLFETRPDVAEHFYFVPQNLINAFPDNGSYRDEDEVYSYREGNLLIHFAGCWVNGQERCQQLFEEYWNRRIPVPNED
ncbi:hypothetical protein K493DRAFT_303137 [Basidiobolus meristosporus CBS 931.73]|uniref:Galactosyl transferase n=1 Tax=Basidiobolus meristosporus CBS 931.73 TaxID=1314790 RepID=A0A1Y1Y3W6_9FUNG|nr:hypothetical protein K493DRAFT_303137 [Basidiobolus meristosporus CBS 931.73]|eukprot:ORX92722.1 hypothetical protein K493DRAFT_303137 [Basidiobolus meristosporus CBS 931.73]